MPLLILEVKTLSPFGFRSQKPWDELFALAERHADMISVHTDPRWGGSLDLIRKARRLTKKPILAKGIHGSDEDIRKAIEAGADHVLVVGRIPQAYADRCLIEPLSLAELKTIPPDLKAVWNSRDLSDGGSKRETFEEARRAFSGWLCQASNIMTKGDIKKGADAVLVGSHLESFVRSL